jgi:NADH-quinone oxidoreductase subunit N
MGGVNYLELLTLAMPETLIVLVALLVLAVDLLFMRDDPMENRQIITTALACFGCAGAIFFMFNSHAHGNALHGMLVVDPLTQLAKAALLVLTCFTLLISLSSRFTSHVGEFVALILFATVGMMFLVSAEDLLMIFVALELTSLSLYILTAFQKEKLGSSEAALKYFLFGGMAAAFTLFGLSLIYGLSGATNLREIAANLKGKGIDPLLLVAIVMTVIGFGFKIAAVPFHLWAPDAYQGAPTPSAAFIASGSKVASFFVLAKVMMLGFAGAEGSGVWRQFVSGWVPVLATIALFSMILGNLAAIAQSNVKRLIAYSAVAHGGYALLGVLCDTNQGLASLLYYVVTYAFTVIGALGVVSVVEARAGESNLNDFAGLSRSAPIVSICMMIFMLSLAGIPPLAGFFGKFYLFTATAAAARDLGLLWLVIAAIAMSAVSLYYYLQVLKQIFVATPAGDTPSTAAKPSLATVSALALLALIVLVLGCLPDLVVSPLLSAMQSVGF